MSKITNLPNATTAVADDVLIISNATNGSRKITRDNLFASMLDAYNIPLTTITDANDATDPEKIYNIAINGGSNLPSFSNSTTLSNNQLIIRNIGSSTNVFQIAFVRYPQAGYIYGPVCRARRVVSAGVYEWQAWFSISGKHYVAGDSTTFAFKNIFKFSDKVTTYRIYGSDQNTAYEYLVNVAADGTVKMYKIIDTYGVERTMSGAYADNTLTITCNKTLYGGMNLESCTESYYP